MKKRSVPKLSLRRETILSLDREALAGMAGGQFVTSTECIFASGCECPSWLACAGPQETAGHA